MDAFAIVREILEKVSSTRTVLSQNSQRIEFLTHADDGTTFFSRVEHLLKDETVVFGIQHQELFGLWPQYPAFFRIVDRCIESICSHEEGSLPGYIVSVQTGKILAMQYLIPVRYGTLGDQACVAEFSRAFAQGAKVVGLLCSVCYAVREKNGTLSESECMRALYGHLAAVTAQPSLDFQTETCH